MLLGRWTSIPARTEEALGLTFDGIEASNNAASADDVSLNRGPVREIGGGFDSVADPVRGVEAIFGGRADRRERIGNAQRGCGVEAGADLERVAEAIAIRVRKVSIGMVSVHLLPVSEAVAVGIGISRACARIRG